MKHLFLRFFLLGALVIGAFSCQKGDSDETTPVTPPTPPTPPVEYTAKHVANLLIEDYTATWCGYCPRIAYAIHDVTAANSHVFALKIYNDSEKKFAHEATMRNTFGVEGFPTAKLNRTADWNYPETATGLTSYLSLKRPCGIALETQIVNSEAKVTVKIEYATTIPQGAKIVVCLSEDKLVGTQRNYYDDGKGDPIPNFEHNCILRKAATDIFGDLIPADQIKKDNISTFSYSIPLAGYVAENCNIVAFVVDVSTKKVLNVQGAKLGSSKNFEYLSR